MNFTREPIIETIISPREGYRLIVRSTKQSSDEEFTVDAVEVVSFGSALFYRSLEKPHPFLLPVADYQVVEGKESRVVLKNAQFERTIKIGGGREASFKKEAEEDSDEQLLPMGLEDEASDEPTQMEPQGDRRRERRRNRRRRHDQRDERAPQQAQASSDSESSEQPSETPKETHKEPMAPPSFTHLIPPPTQLISDTIQKYKEQQAKEPTPTESPEIVQKEGEGDANTISRSVIEPPPFTSGPSSMSDWSNFLS